MIPASTLQFATSTDPDGTAVLHVRGEADLATAPQLRERLLTEFARHDRLVVDLSRAMLYDGAALRALQALHHQATRTHRQPPALRGVRPLLAKALKATGMHTQFPLQQHQPLPAGRTRRPGAHPEPLSTAA